MRSVPDREEIAFYRFFLLSLFLHLLTILALGRFTSLGRGLPAQASEAKQEVVWLDLQKKLPHDGQVVDLFDQGHSVDEPVDSPYLSDRNRRVKKQTQAFHTASDPQSAGRQHSSRGNKPASAGDGAEKEKTARAERGLTRSGKGLTGRGPNLDLATDWLAQHGASPTNYLPGIEFGDETMLSTREYAHASFFIRMKRQMEQHWNPLPLVRQLPNKEKDKLETTLSIVLNSDGSVDNIGLVHSSGYETLDREAERAVRVAAPFLNIPLPLLGSDGKLTISQWRFIITAYYSL